MSEIRFVYLRETLPTSSPSGRGARIVADAVERRKKLELDPLKECIPHKISVLYGLNHVDHPGFLGHSNR